MVITKSARSSNYLALAAIAVIALALMLAFLFVSSFAPTIAFEVPGRAAAQPLPLVGNELYLVGQGWDGNNSLLLLNPASGKVDKRFDAGYYGTVELTTNRHILYTYQPAHSEDETQKGIISAIDIQTGAALWHVNVPGAPFTGLPTRGAWLSADENLLYLQGSADGLNPQIFVVETQTGTLLHDFAMSLPYPSNVDEAFPQEWKLPGRETLIVASRDQLFTFDLSSGRVGFAIKLFDAESMKHVPSNLPQTAFVEDGALDSRQQRLLLATSTQEILDVDLSQYPFKVTPVIALPIGWQFAIAQSVLLNPIDKSIYIQVKRQNTPARNGLEAEEVWRYDTTNWTRTARLSLREQLAALLGSGSASAQDLTNQGLALSDDGQHVYSLTAKGPLQINQASGGLKGIWTATQVLGIELARVFAVQ